MRKAKIVRGAVLIAGLAALQMSGAACAQLAPEALKQAQQNFKTADAGGTGALAAADFKTFVDLNAASGIGRAAKIKANNAYDRAFGKVDANKDGKVTWDEYLAAQ